MQLRVIFMAEAKQKVLFAEINHDAKISAIKK
jgi:hypothetical protein